MPLAAVFDGVLTEALDRLSRDQEDIAGIFKRLSYARVNLLTVAEGEISELHIGFKGTMNALFLRDLAAKIRRGQRGRAAEGLTPGGRSYGYEVVRALDAKGELLRGRRRIIEEEAAVVRRIFEEYVAGHSARKIAARLNRDGIPSPTGKAWGAATINGSRSRASGILYNEAYVGRLVFNRTSFSKNPETGRRVSRPLPTADRVVTSVEDLRVVSDELWAAAQARKARYSNMPLHQRRRPRHPFSGLVRCGLCGGAFTVKNRDQLACATHREKGACDNNRTIRIGELERPGDRRPARPAVVAGKHRQPRLRIQRRARQAACGGPTPARRARAAYRPARTPDQASGRGHRRRHCNPGNARKADRRRGRARKARTGAGLVRGARAHRDRATSARNRAISAARRRAD